jgi:hypothetical protein
MRGARSADVAGLPMGFPERVPWRLACLRPAATRSRIWARSNSLKAARSCTIRRPWAVVMSMLSCTLTKATPAASSSVTVPSTSRVLRPQRSSFQTTTASYARAWASPMRRWRAGLCFAPLAFSSTVATMSQPRSSASLRMSASCIAVSWLPVSRFTSTWTKRVS